MAWKTGIYSLSVPEATSPKSRCCRPRLFLRSWCSPETLLFGAYGCVTPLSAPSPFGVHRVSVLSQGTFLFCKDIGNIGLSPAWWPHLDYIGNDPILRRRPYSQFRSWADLFGGHDETHKADYLWNQGTQNVCRCLLYTPPSPSLHLRVSWMESSLGLTWGIGLTCFHSVLTGVSDESGRKDKPTVVH